MSFYGNDGTFFAAGEPAWSEGHRNSGIDCDGTSGYVSVTSSTDF